MSKSVEELFRNAPADATHYAAHCHYKIVGDTWMVHMSGDEWEQSESMYNGQIKPSDIVARPQPKPWSGPEDGLPPVGTVCEVKGCMSHYLKWNKVTVFAVRGKTVMFDMEDGRWGQTESHEFRAIQTPEQLRETAIRELMDIAQVDCRVTAARLVDAGFKREVV